MTRDIVVTAGRIVSAAIAVAPFLWTAARAGTITSGISTSATIGYSTNPYLLENTNGGVVRGQVSLSPFVEEKTSRSSLRVAANAAFSKFSGQYRDTVDLSTQVGYTNTLTRKLSVRAGLSINSSFGGSGNTERIFDPISPVDVVPRDPDITLVGFQSRTTRAQGSAGLSYALNNKNSFTLGYDASVVRFPGSIGRSEYSSLSQSAGYSRVINPRFNAGASVSVARVNYFGGPLGDAVIISPSLNGALRLSSRWSLTGGLGFSSSRVNIVGGQLRSTDLSASLSACRVDTRTSWCLNGARSTGASSFDGVRTTTTFGTSYSYKINTRDTISASGGYSRSAAPQNSFRGSTTYLSGTTTYARRLSERLSGQLTGGFTRSTFEGTRSNAYASIGINYSFGTR